MGVRDRSTGTPDSAGGAGVVAVVGSRVRTFPGGRWRLPVGDELSAAAPARVSAVNVPVVDAGALSLNEPSPPAVVSWKVSQPPMAGAGANQWVRPAVRGLGDG